MKWKKTSEFSITDGRFHIAKSLVNGKEDYMLWDGHKIVGHWLTPEEAKNEAADIRNQELVATSAGGL